MSTATESSDPADAVTFRPAYPTDSAGVLRLFAVAARVICERPDALEVVSRTLLAATARLVPPERLAAEECRRLWELFIRVARRPKASLRVEAGRAFYRDLDAIGQRLDLPPMQDWETIATSLTEPNGIDIAHQVEPENDATTIDEVRARARGKVKKRAQGAPLAARDVLQQLSELSPATRDKLLHTMAGAGAITKGDVALLDRAAMQGEKLGKGQDMLVEALENAGRWLVKEDAQS